MAYFNKEIAMDVHSNLTAESLKRALLTTILLLFANAISQAQSKELYSKETIVAGGPNQFMEVRHVVLKGSNYEIGKKIAEIVRRDGVQMQPFGDPLRNKVQREYMERNYPIIYERMKGVADVFGLSIENDAHDFSAVPQHSELFVPSGCSAVFYPAQFTKSGHDILSRNFDFSTGTLGQGKRPQAGEMVAMARPYVFEVYPDKGYPSLYLCAFDLLGGVLDGINSEGLAVGVLAENEGAAAGEATDGIGMHEILSMRYLLDNCKSIVEAKQAMLYLKHYYTFLPCHYIIADKQGNSFVFEFSPSRNRTFIVDGTGPQCVTNHLISKYQRLDDVPEKNQNMMRYSFSRLNILHEACKQGDKFGLDEVKAINLKVAAPPFASNDPAIAPHRTLWHSIYDLDERKLSVKFYLGEEPEPKDKRKVLLKYSDYVDFQLSTN
jgi:predicted choloylglycine hydrolase